MTGKRNMLSALLLAATLTLMVAALPAYAEDQSKPQTITGTLSKVDLTNNTVTITASSSEVTYVVEATAEIRIKGKEGSLADLATGTAVTAEVKGKKIVALHA